MAINRTRVIMNQSVQDCIVTGHQDIIHSLKLPDQSDRHVLAAAIVGKCDVSVTQNLKDFPMEALKPHMIEAIHPDNFLSDCLILLPESFCLAVRNIRSRINNPSYSVEEYLAILARQGLSKVATELEKFKDLL